MSERVLICGSRPPEKVVREYEAMPPEYRALLEKVRTYVRELPIDTVVITGGALGVDRTAFAAAWDRGMIAGEFPVGDRHWHRLGKPCGHIRNAAMLDSNITRVVAFMFGEMTPGTAGCIEQARRRGIPVEVIR